MYNCYKTVQKLINEQPPLSTFLLGADNYYAHTPNNNNRSTKETLEEHINLVNSYFVKLVSSHQLDIVLDKLINGLSPTIDQDTGNYIKQLFINTIVFHDYGKINECFQAKKMNNGLFNGATPENSPIGSSHSALGAYIYLTKHLNEIYSEKKGNSLLTACCLYFSYSIFKHHSKRFDDDYFSTIGFADLKARNNIEELRTFLSLYLNKYQFNIPPEIIKLIGEETFLKYPTHREHLISFELYALCRLNFSLLTAADYLATNEYINELPVVDIGTFTKERINILHYNVSKREWIDKDQLKKNYNKSIYDSLENYQFQNPVQKGSNYLNMLRQEMAIEVIRNIRKFHDSNLFFIEAPTGGGKTNLSMLAVIELLKMHEGAYNKVFYVFPFTTLITQTYSVVRDMLGMNEDEIIELHSKAGMKQSCDEDDQYGNEKLNYINHIFVNYPFCLLSHIRFFDIIKTNEKEANYLLHRLANSIVVIDELQSYNPVHWDKVIYFIRKYADTFNIKFILMSATLPKLNKLEVITQNVKNFVYLLPTAKDQYFRNPNFSDRVNFNFDLFDRADLTLKELGEKIIQTSKEYIDYDFGNAKPAGSVYTIIEFIYKQPATDFYTIIKEYNFFDEILVLSGTILEHRRKQIINFLKNPDNRKKKVLLITTQVVEAGVDIDMDIGFKDRSIIDSDEQLAGRINRNVNKDHCTLYLFNYNKESVIYGKDLRFKVTREKIKAAEYRRILKEKDFDALYDKIFEDQNRKYKNILEEHFIDYKLALTQLRFQTVHEKFRLIEQQNISCFIPINIPVFIESSITGKPEPIFSDTELAFLHKNNIEPDENNTISGEEVFDLYLDSIWNKIEFTQQRIRKKSLQSILSKYVISIFSSPKMTHELIHFHDKEKSDYGYMYLNRWRKIYSIEKGLDAKKLADIEESQFL